MPAPHTAPRPGLTSVFFSPSISVPCTRVHISHSSPQPSPEPCHHLLHSISVISSLAPPTQPPPLISSLPASSRSFPPTSPNLQLFGASCPSISASVMGPCLTHLCLWLQASTLVCGPTPTTQTRSLAVQASWEVSCAPGDFTIPFHSSL